VSSQLDQGADTEPGAPAGRTGFRNSLKNLRTFSSLRNPVFRTFFMAALGQSAAMNMQMFARGLLIFRLTGSGAILGGMALANAVPLVFLALFGGVLADRIQKKLIILIGHVFSAGLSLGIALALTTGYLSPEREGSWWILVVASAIQGAIMGLTMPSRESIVREIVDVERVLNAISLNTMGMNGLRLLAPALTGFLIDRFDFEAVYFAMTGLYAVAALLLSVLPRTSRPSSEAASAFDGVRKGFRYLRGQVTVMLVLGFVLLGIMLSQPYSLLMPMFAETVLKIDATEMGLLLSVSGGGAIAGSLVLASMPNRKRGLLLLGSTVLLSVALVAFAFSDRMNLSLGIIVFVGLGQAGLMTLAGTLIQYYVDPAYLGRVMSILMMQFGFISVGTFGAGLLAEAVGVQWAVGSFAVALGVMALLALAFVPRLRNLE
jgi:MFS family permease